MAKRRKGNKRKQSHGSSSSSCPDSKTVRNLTASERFLKEENGVLKVSLQRHTHNPKTSSFPL
jgi:hypothetical protein